MVRLKQDRVKQLLFPHDRVDHLLPRRFRGLTIALPVREHFVRGPPCDMMRRRAKQLDIALLQQTEVGLMVLIGVLRQEGVDPPPK